MKILDYIPQIAAAGAMGVSILCILRVAALLKTEQQKEVPRPVFLRSIYIFMGFGLVMTLVALGIEFSRFFMGTNDGEIARLSAELQKLEARDLYALNENGNPAPITLDAAGRTYTIAEPFPDTAFGETPLNLVTRAGKYRAVKNNNGREINYGYLPEQELKTQLSGLFDGSPVAPPPPPATAAENPENTYAAGRAFTPGSILAGLKLRNITDVSKANRRLIDFLSAPAAENETLRKEAVKLLIQPRMMDELSEDGHNRLIALLSDNTVRNTPWRYYEAAQVYLSRYHLMEETNPEDLEQHLALSRLYLNAFAKKGWTAEQRPAEYLYYRSAAKAIGRTLQCNTCLLGE